MTHPSAAAVLSAAEAALRTNPSDPRALLNKALALAQLKRFGEAAAAYQTATRALAGRPDLSAEVRSLLERARAIPAELARAFEAAARERIDAAGPPSARMREALDIQLGKTRIYVQEPLKFYFPGLPQIAFYEREAFPWARSLEACAPTIRRELEGVLAKPEAFAPYIDETPEGVSDPSGLSGNMNWSACFLYKNGAPNPSMLAACPETMAALQVLPLAFMPNRGPSILFSALRPGATIPPHFGFVNTRLICHLPLLAPDGCALRVGAHVRPWREGELLIFDDSFEHEAWNRSDKLRVVLLFDVWRPELTPAERDQVNALFAAVDEVSGARPAWGA